MLNEQIEKEFLNIKQRNQRVEANKSWEMSKIRRGFIAGATYIIAGTWLSVIYDSNMWLKAIIATAGYLLSTLSLPLVKNGG